MGWKFFSRDEQMRFSILTQYYPPEVGAPQARLPAIAREVKRRGHEVQVLTAMPNYPEGRIYRGYRRKLYLREAADGISVKRTWVFPSTGRGFSRLLNYSSFSATSLFPLLLATRPDVVFVESPPLFLGLNGVFLKKLRNVPFVFNVADLWPDSVKELGVIENKSILAGLYRIERAIYTDALMINAVTEGIRDRIVNEKNIDPAKVVFFPNGVDTAVFFPVEEDSGLRAELGLDGRPVFVYPGTIGIAQGLDVILRAAKILEEERTQAAFLLVGAGSDRARLEDLSRDLGLTSVRFLNPVAPHVINRILALSVAGIVTLKNLPLLEGARPSKFFPIMASKKPIIFSGAGEAGRLIDDGGFGVVCEPEDERELASAIRWCIENRSVAEEMGARGEKLARGRFAWSTLIDPWITRLEFELESDQRGD